MDENTTETWQRKPAALRDLILLALHESGGVIIDDTGRVASYLRRLLGTPDDKNSNNRISTVLHQLTAEGTIARRMNEQQTRTYEISLTRALDDNQIVALVAAREANLARLVDATPQTELDQLIGDCQSAYEALQDAADKAKRITANGHVAINVTGVLQAIGLPRAKARPVRYYLRELGLARSLSAVDDGTDTQLWWWTVSNRPLDIDRLRDLATSNNSYEATQARKRGTPQASEVVVRRVESTVGDSASTNSKPVVNTSLSSVRTPTPADLDRKRANLVAPPVIEEDPLETLTAIAERLDEENNSLREQLSSQETRHQEEVAGLREQIRTLEGQLGARQQVSQRANELIARLGHVAAS